MKKELVAQTDALNKNIKIKMDLLKTLRKPHEKDLCRCEINKLKKEVQQLKRM